MERLVRIAAFAALGVAALAQGTVAEGPREEAPRVLDRPSATPPTVDAGGGLRDPAARSPTAGPPALGDPNRGLDGYYRNTIGMTPPGGRTRSSGRD